MVVETRDVLLEGWLHRRCFEMVQETYQEVRTVWELTLAGVRCLGLRHATGWNKKGVAPQRLGNIGRCQQY